MCTGPHFFTLDICLLCMDAPPQNSQLFAVHRSSFLLIISEIYCLISIPELKIVGGGNICEDNSVEYRRQETEENEMSPCELTSNNNVRRQFSPRCATMAGSKYPYSSKYRIDWKSENVHFSNSSKEFLELLQMSSC